MSMMLSKLAHGFGLITDQTMPVWPMGALFGPEVRMIKIAGEKSINLLLTRLACGCPEQSSSPPAPDFGQEVGASHR